VAPSSLRASRLAIAVPAAPAHSRTMRALLRTVAAAAPGCAFHPRCRYAVERCRLQVPALREILPGRAVRCHRAEELELHAVAVPAERRLAARAS